MKSLSFPLAIIVIFIFTSCEDKRITAYKQIVDQTARFKITFQNAKKSFFLKQPEADQFKQVLADKIEPDTMSAFVPDTRIDLLDKEHREMASIKIIHNNRPTANFISPDLNFGFQLTYRIGMWISELRRQHN